MTKKHYELIASVINGAVISASEYGNEDDIAFIKESVAEPMADALEKDNPKFDRAKFLEACGVIA